MKLILCGKGGCGKSTISALLARACERNGMNVLVVDADESNFGLHKQLGLPLPKDFTLFFGFKKGIFQDGAEDVFAGGWTFDDLPAEYVSRSGKIRLMAMGKIAQAGEGCACPMGVLTKAFLEHLKLGGNDIVIVDTEAGVEHFGRGVDRFADAILMVADPSYESVQLAGKILAMGASFGKPVYLILNKADDQQSDMMKEALPSNAQIIASIPMDREILMAGLRGDALSAVPPQIEVILQKILK